MNITLIKQFPIVAEIVFTNIYLERILWKLFPEASNFILLLIDAISRRKVESHIENFRWHVKTVLIDTRVVTSTNEGKHTKKRVLDFPRVLATMPFSTAMPPRCIFSAGLFAVYRNDGSVNSNFIGEIVMVAYEWKFSIQSTSTVSLLMFCGN